VSVDRRTLLVRIGEIAVTESPGVLKTTLGSCVAVVLHDAGKAIAGLAHIMLPERLGEDSAAGKYADTAIPKLLAAVMSRGCRKERVEAHVVGGAAMFGASPDQRIATVGQKNVAAVKTMLESLAIPVVFEDTGGNRGRTVIFDCEKGKACVKALKPVGERVGV
jgi:chemotaxis protein CheD